MCALITKVIFIEAKSSCFSTTCKYNCCHWSSNLFCNFHSFISTNIFYFNGAHWWIVIVSRFQKSNVLIKGFKSALGVEFSRMLPSALDQSLWLFSELWNSLQAVLEYWQQFQCLATWHFWGSQTLNLVPLSLILASVLMPSNHIAPLCTVPLYNIYIYILLWSPWNFIGGFVRSFWKARNWLRRNHIILKVPLRR